MKNKAIAILLLVFLGFFGTHRMYLRRFKSTAIMFLLTVIGIAMFAIYPVFYPQAGPLYRGFAALLLVIVTCWCLIDFFLIPY